MVSSDRALAISYRLSICNHFSICSGLAAIFNGKFQATSSRIGNGEIEPKLLVISNRK